MTGNHESLAPPPVEPDRLEAMLAEGALVVDTRSASEYANGHLRGTINLPLGPSFAERAAHLVPRDRALHLIVEDERLEEAVRELATVALDRIGGHVAPGDLFRALPGCETIPQMGVEELAERMRAGEVAVIDVREPAEWEAGHLPGAENIPLSQIAARIEEIPRDRPLVLHCQAGGRSAIVASVLRSRGFDDVRNLSGGYAEWEASGGEVEPQAPPER